MCVGKAALWFDADWLKAKRRKEEGKDLQSINQVPRLTQDTTWESDKNTRNNTYKRAKRLALSQQVTTRLQLTEKTAWQTRNTNNKKDPQKKHRLGTVCNCSFTEELKLVSWYQPHSYFWCGSWQIDVWFAWKISWLIDVQQVALVFVENLVRGISSNSHMAARTHLSKAISSLFLSEMIAQLQSTLSTSTALQNKDQTH